MSKTQKTCGEPATISFAWNGKQMYQCAFHAGQIATLAHHMNWPICMHHYVGDKTCSQAMPEEE